MKNSLPFGHFELDYKMKYLSYYHLVGLIWVNAFIIASVEFVIDGSVCIW